MARGEDATDAAPGGDTPSPPGWLSTDRRGWPMVGRDTELEALRSELDAGAGGRRLAVVSGETGIGKTRLAAELAAGAAADGIVVLPGSARKGLEKPYLPFIDAFGHGIDRASPEMLAAAEGGLGDLARLLPEMRERLGESTVRTDSPASEQFAMFKAAVSLLRLLSRDAPVLLVLEDLHWADPATLLLLHFLLSGRGGFAGLVLVTHNPGETASGTPLAGTLGQLGREPGFARLELTGLSAGHLRSLLAGLGLPDDPALAAELCEETAGNPLFATGLLEAHAGSGELRPGALREAAAPPLVQEAIDLRVAAAGDRAREVLGLAALSETEIDPERIELALDAPPGELAPVWRAAERSALLDAEPGGALRFRHPLVKRALRDQLGAARGDLERRLAAASGERRSAPETDAALLERRGDHWAIRLDRSDLTLRDSKGVRYLARLLSAPGVEMHALDLQGEGLDPDARASATRGAPLDSDLHVGSGDAGPMLDEQAKQQYRVRIEELEAEIEEAEAFNDPERGASAREELEFVGQELSRAVGLHGRDRRASSDAERARINVTRAIRGTIGRISEHDATLGGHLSASMRTGTFCCYEPIPGQAIRWRVRPSSG